MKKDRRDFLKKTLTAAAATAASSQFLQAAGADGLNEGEGLTFLFQGDSITDGNRTRNDDWNHVMGHGYQYIIASKLWYEKPQKRFHFFNRGISGNKVTDLTARWQKDTLDIKPDVLSILVGINDVAAYINGNGEFSAENYASGYRSLLESARKALPSIRLVLCEPFVLKVGPKVTENWDLYFSEAGKRQQIVKALSKEFDSVFVPFQEAFDKALSRAPAQYWIWDGIHPMPAGHQLMAEVWLQHVGKKFKFIL